MYKLSFSHTKSGCGFKLQKLPPAEASPIFQFSWRFTRLTVIDRGRAYATNLMLWLVLSFRSSPVKNLIIENLTSPRLPYGLLWGPPNCWRLAQTWSLCSLWFLLIRQSIFFEIKGCEGRGNDCLHHFGISKHTTMIDCNSRYSWVLLCELVRICSLLH